MYNASMPMVLMHPVVTEDQYFPLMIMGPGTQSEVFQDGAGNAIFFKTNVYKNT